MEKKFDKPGRGALGTALLRYVKSKSAPADPVSKSRTDRTARDNHIATGLPEGLDSATLDTWVDKLVALNDKCKHALPDSELVEVVLMAAPDSIHDTLDTVVEKPTGMDAIDATRCVQMLGP